jgi:regulator of protease activity HflC (stomatin/prohibitin superfamily)
LIENEHRYLFQNWNFVRKKKRKMETAIVIITIAVAITVWALGVKWIRESFETVTIWDYQVGLHFKHGRYLETLESGKHRIWGRGHSVILFDSRLSEMVVQGQELMTSDSATVKLTAVAQWKIADALAFHQGAENAPGALYTQIQLAMRELISGLALDAILERKVDFGKTLLKGVADSARAELGIEVVRIEIRDVILGGELKSSYAGVITARKEAEAKQERARGDAAALRTFANAARVYETNPELFRLRYLETLKELGAGYGNQLIVGVPEDLMGLVKKET